MMLQAEHCCICMNQPAAARCVSSVKNSQGQQQCLLTSMTSREQTIAATSRRGGGSAGRMVYCHRTFTTAAVNSQVMLVANAKL